MDDVELGCVVGEFDRSGPNQEVAREQRMPGAFRHQAHRQLVPAIGAAPQVLDEQVFLGEVRANAQVERVENVAGNRLIDLAPGDVGFDGGMPHDELVLGRAAGVGRGVDDQGSALGKASAAAPDGLLHQERFR